MSQKQQQAQNLISAARPQQTTSGAGQHEHPLQHLQHTVGNQAVHRMVEAHATARVIQTKLAINQPGDEYEQEADHVAEQVMRLPDSQLQRSCTCGGTCSKCQTEQSGHEHEHMQMKRVQESDAGQATAPPIVDEVLRSPGQPLDPATRAFMEPRFGHDFSGVRVHAGATAEQSAQDVNARAYTVGPNVVFAAGQFAPGTQEGRRLLAHELVHTIQQSAGRALQREPVDVKTVPDVAPVFPTRIPDNEAEAIEDTAIAYPTDKAVQDAIVTLPQVVQDDLGSNVEYQRKFLYRTSLYLGPHPKPIEHFKGITKFTFHGSGPENDTLYLHASALAHLQDVENVIGAKNMPSSGTGFSLRGLIRQEGVPPPGLMVHALGYAIDFRAVLNPHIKDPRLVAVQALYARASTTFHMQTGAWTTRRETIKKMGRGEIAEDSKEAKEFIESFRLEGSKDLQGSNEITHEITSEKLKELHSLRPQYKDVMEKMRTTQKKIDMKKVLTKSKAWSTLDTIKEFLPLFIEWSELTMTREDLIARTQQIFSGLMDKTASEIASIHAFPYVAGSDKEYTETLERLAQEARAASDAEHKANREYEHARTIYNQYDKQIVHLELQIKAEKNDARRERLQQQLKDKQIAMSNVARPAIKESFAKWGSTSSVSLKSTEELTHAKSASGKRQWLHSLTSLQKALSVESFDPKFIFGIGREKEVETDNAVVDPSLVQLFSKGFFNLDPPVTPVIPQPTTPTVAGHGKKPPEPHQGFTLQFIEEMAKHGLDQGSEWNPGGVDSMHFEFVEGVDALHFPSDAKKKK